MAIPRELAEPAWHIARGAVLAGCVAWALYTVIATRAEVERLAAVVAAQAAEETREDEGREELLAEVEMLRSEISLVREQLIATQDTLVWTMRVAAETRQRPFVRRAP